MLPLKAGLCPRTVAIMSALIPFSRSSTAAMSVSTIQRQPTWSPPPVDRSPRAPRLLVDDVAPLLRVVVAQRRRHRLAGHARVRGARVGGDVRPGTHGDPRSGEGRVG